MGCAGLRALMNASVSDAEGEDEEDLLRAHPQGLGFRAHGHDANDPKPLQSSSQAHSERRVWYEEEILRSRQRFRV